jgi:tetratricopeptide (TPR) repeat protein
LRALARSAPIDELPAVNLDLLGSALRDAGDPQAAEGVLRRAQRRLPGDVWLNYNLAQCLEKLARREEAIRYYTAARSIRPETAHELAHALRDNREADEAIAVFQELTRLRPGRGRHLLCLGWTLQQRGRAQEAGVALDAAIAAMRKDIRQKPDDIGINCNLGSALWSQGKLDEAIAQFREAIRLRPDDAGAHWFLATILRIQGKLDEAIAQFREASRLKPDDAGAHVSLGDALRGQGQVEEAIAEYRSANRLQPDYHHGHEHLGDALLDQGKLEEAIREYRIANRIDPACTDTLNRLAWGLALSPRRPRADYDEAVVHARKGVALAPKDGNQYNTLALAEHRVGHWAESIAASERSMALRNGGVASDWFFLAMAHWQKGEKDEARKWFDKAVARTKEKDPKNTELRGFWTEAAVLLGQPGPVAAGTGSPAAPAAEKPH